MNNAILTEAFKKLNILEEEDFNLGSSEEVQEAEDFIDNDELDDTLDIMDLDAEEEVELSDSYIGKVVLECEVCHSKVFEDKDSVVFDEESHLANVTEECPYCFSTDGFKVIGQVAPFGEVEEEIEVEEEPVDEIADDLGEDGEPIEVDETEIVEESLNEELTYDDVQHMNDSERHNLFKEYHNGIDFKDENDFWNWAEGEFPFEEMGESLNECGKFKKGECKNDALNEGDVCPECGQNPCKCGEELEEDFKDISVTTDDSHMTMTSDDEGKVTVTTEPIHDEFEDDFIEEEPGDEMLAPIEDETVIDIAEEQPIDDEEDFGEEDIDIDEFDEEGFDELGESYLTKVYDNVNSFKTRKITESKNKLYLEGIISFKSGSKKKTSFILEAKDITKKGKIRFIGENKEITRGKKAFTVAGRMNGKKFMCESLNYNYRAKNEDGKSTRVYGTIKKK